MKTGWPVPGKKRGQVRFPSYRWDGRDVPGAVRAYTGCPFGMNTFDVKWYEDSALAYWVAQKVIPVNRFQFEQIVEDHQMEIVDGGNKVIDFHRTMRYVMFDWGWVIETCHVDDEGTATIETLISYTGNTATITHRHRCGPNHDEMKAYLRDSEFPVPCVVRLKR